VKEALRLIAADGLVVARHVQQKNLAKAMLVKVEGLDSNNDRVRQAVATEIIEWEMGKAQQKVQHSGNVAAQVHIIMPDNGRGDNAGPARGAADPISGDAG